MSDFPAVAPTLNLDFANSRQLDPRVTFRRSSTGTYVDSDGVIKTASIDQPRFDFDPVTGVCNGLLIEEAKTNSSTYSRDWSNAAYIPVGTITPNAGLAPDGTFTAAIVSGGARRIMSVASCFSIFYKPITAYRVSINFDGSSGAITFDTTTQTTSGTAGGVSGIIQKYADGWYRCIVPVGSGSVNWYMTPVSGSGYFWGMQAENGGNFATSFIPTVASSVTRSADVANVTGTNFSSWFNQNQGTILHSGRFIADVATNTYGRNNGLVFRIGNSDLSAFSNQWWAGGYRAAGPSLPPFLEVGLYSGTNYTSLQTASRQFNVPVGSKMNVASYIDTTNKFISSAFNGGNVAKSAITSSPTWNFLTLTQAYDGSTRCGHISRVTYWPQRLSDSQLIALTKR